MKCWASMYVCSGFYFKVEKVKYLMYGAVILDAGPRRPSGIYEVAGRILMDSLSWFVASEMEALGKLRMVLNWSRKRGFRKLQREGRR